jgi:hypothetical protein
VHDRGCAALRIGERLRAADLLVEIGNRCLESPELGILVGRQVALFSFGEIACY